MGDSNGLLTAAAVLKKAKELGASLAGICRVADLKQAPSFTLAPRLPRANVGSREGRLGLKPGEVYWPEAARTTLVIARAHPAEEPSLDWWTGDADSGGNKILRKINRELSSWIETAFGVKTFPLSYHVERGGIFLKDAAVLAGLGCIGRNNLFLSPEYGPRIRLRALLLAAELPASGPREYDPCTFCPAPCREACPREAFGRRVYWEEEWGQDILPGSGRFDRARCNLQMREDMAAAGREQAGTGEKPALLVKYCRRCELSCPVGR